MSPGRDPIPDPFARAVVLFRAGWTRGGARAPGRDGRACSAISFDYGQRHKARTSAAPARRGVARRSARTPHHGRDRPPRYRRFGPDGREHQRAQGPSRTGVSRRWPGPPAVQRSAIRSRTSPHGTSSSSQCRGYAETIGAGEIYLGVNAVGLLGVPLTAESPSCGPSSTRRCWEPRSASKRWRRTSSTAAMPALRVVSPLVHPSARRSSGSGSELGVDFSLTHSCYDPVRRGDAVLACGRCDSCSIRRAGSGRGRARPDTLRLAARMRSSLAMHETAMTDSHAQPGSAARNDTTLPVSELFVSVQERVGSPAHPAGSSGSAVATGAASGATPSYASWRPESTAMTVRQIIEAPVFTGPRGCNVRHAVVTGGEPMMFPGVVDPARAQGLRHARHHRDRRHDRTATCLCDLFSVSPKLSNSTLPRRKLFSSPPEATLAGSSETGPGRAGRVGTRSAA